MEKELLHRFFDGRASVEEEKQVLDWIDRDPANRRELLAERRLFDSMLMLADPGRTTRKPKDPAALDTRSPQIRCGHPGRCGSGGHLRLADV
jgi:anti-sigma factor RsiW